MEPSNNEIEVLRFLFYKVRKTSQSRNGKESKKINSTRRWEGLSELFNCPSYERCIPESKRETNKTPYWNPPLLGNRGN